MFNITKYWRNANLIHLCVAHSSLKKKIYWWLHARHHSTLGLQRWVRLSVYPWRSSQSRQIENPFCICAKCHRGTWPGRLGGVSRSNRTEAPRRDAAPAKRPAGVEAIKGALNAMRERRKASMLRMPGLHVWIKCGAGGGWIQASLFFRKSLFCSKVQWQKSQ